ncbi:hypothetical protein NM688_g6055 [Phlebia brevispora]|uniref:Uncharacterized protein n=1 Tax=Phlebia brevispora TaxID=194682 RepID=A0ACC1SKB5_9APHY|nr:hypothetical protein NM688_g6055 [Phlebia brevispora]
MSASTSNSVTVTEFRADLVQNYSIFASLVIVCYEFIITLQDEYEFIWRRKRTVATWLFLTNRYLMLAVAIANARKIWFQTCSNISLINFLNVLAQLLAFILAVFSTLRVFALLDRAYVSAAAVFLLGLISIATDFYQASRMYTYYVDDSLLGPSCYFKFRLSASALFYCKKHDRNNVVVLTNLAATLAGVLSTIVADIIVIVATWLRTYRHVRQASFIGMSARTSTVLLHHGTLYFVVLCIVNLADLLVLLVPSSAAEDPVTIIADILPNILISRFLINLRQAGHTDPGNVSHFSVSRFHLPTIASIIGDLGEPLAHGEENLDEDLIEAHVEAGQDRGSICPNLGNSRTDVRDVQPPILDVS